MKVFENYPNAKPLWKVGGKHFLNYQEKQAREYARMTGKKITTVKAPAMKVAKAKTESDGTK